MSPREVRCACGALNDESFRTCIRCGERLDGSPRPARPAARRPTEDDGGTTYGRAAVFVGGLCAVVFALQLQMLAKAGMLGRVLLSSGTVEAQLKAGMLVPVVEFVVEQPYRLVSSIYAHHGLIHFGLNMMALAGLAKSAEVLVGSSRTVIAFVLTGIVGNLATVGVHVVFGGSVGMSAGASGGILGVMGLLIGVLLRRGNPAWKNIAMNAVFYAVLFGFAVNSASTNIKINNAAHIGGLLSGIALGLLWYRREAIDSPLTRGFSGALFALSAVSVVLSLFSEDVFDLAG